MLELDQCERAYKNVIYSRSKCVTNGCVLSKWATKVPKLRGDNYDNWVERVCINVIFTLSKCSLYLCMSHDISRDTHVTPFLMRLPASHVRGQKFTKTRFLVKYPRAFCPWGGALQNTKTRLHPYMRWDTGDWDM